MLKIIGIEKKEIQNKNSAQLRANQTNIYFVYD